MEELEMSKYWKMCLRPIWASISCCLSFSVL